MVPRPPYEQYLVAIPLMIQLQLYLVLVPKPSPSFRSSFGLGYLTRYLVLVPDVSHSKL